MAQLPNHDRNNNTLRWCGTGRCEGDKAYIKSRYYIRCLDKRSCSNDCFNVPRPLHRFEIVIFHRYGVMESISQARGVDEAGCDGEWQDARIGKERT